MEEKDIKNNAEQFTYAYSSREQDEIKKIRNKYLAPDEREDKMAQLLRLDASVTKKGTLISLIFGIIGSIVLGIGMCLAMDVLSIPYGMPIGIAVGIIGIACIIVAYPLYTRITEKEKARLAPEILRLTDELMNR
ncbi:MAG: hypothetical protein IKL59_00945 [Clostridia bacterium]|nr:hypothetical protein [Clostridia bacterium]